MAQIKTDGHMHVMRSWIVGITLVVVVGGATFVAVRSFLNRSAPAPTARQASMDESGALAPAMMQNVVPSSKGSGAPMAVTNGKNAIRAVVNTNQTGGSVQKTVGGSNTCIWNGDKRTQPGGSAMSNPANWTSDGITKCDILDAQNPPLLKFDSVNSPNASLTAVWNNPNAPVSGSAITMAQGNKINVFIDSPAGNAIAVGTIYNGGGKITTSGDFTLAKPLTLANTFASWKSSNLTMYTTVTMLGGSDMVVDGLLKISANAVVTEENDAHIQTQDLAIISNLKLTGGRGIYILGTLTLENGSQFDLIQSTVRFSGNSINPIKNNGGKIVTSDGSVEYMGIARNIEVLPGTYYNVMLGANGAAPQGPQSFVLNGNLTAHNFGGSPYAPITINNSRLETLYLANQGDLTFNGGTLQLRENGSFRTNQQFGKAPKLAFNGTTINVGSGSVADVSESSTLTLNQTNMMFAGDASMAIYDKSSVIATDGTIINMSNGGSNLQIGVGNTPGSMTVSNSTINLATADNKLAITQGSTLNLSTAGTVLTANGIILNAGRILLAPGARLVHPAKRVMFTDGSYVAENPALDAQNNTVYILVEDSGLNLDGTKADVIKDVVVDGGSFGDSATVDLVETGPSTGIFISTPIQLEKAKAKIGGDAVLQVNGSDSLTFTFKDPNDFSETKQASVSYSF